MPAHDLYNTHTHAHPTLPSHFTPDSPETVNDLAPIFSANHRISIHPCAITAASALFPNPIPSTIPAAIASTFFKAPHISTPTTSRERLTLMLALANSCCTSRASCLSYVWCACGYMWVCMWVCTGGEGGGNKGGFWGVQRGETPYASATKHMLAVYTHTHTHKRTNTHIHTNIHKQTQTQNHNHTHTREATTSAVGRPSITSAAKEGPDKNAVGCRRPKAEGMSWCMS